MRIGLAQIDCEVGNVRDNTAKMVHYIREAAAAHCDVVTFPEMSDTGYLLSTAVGVACAWDVDGAPARSVQQAAKESNINVVAGLSERDAKTNAVFNGIAIVNREGELIGRYHKTHLVTTAPMFEDKILSAGNELTVCNIDSVPSGVMTCYEVRFPEVCRSLALLGAEIIFLSAAWPIVRANHWNALTKARAIENQAFVVATNRVGTDGADLTFCGSSQVIDPFGVTVGAASEVDERLLVADIDMAAIKQTRLRIRVFDDRRPELYGALVQTQLT